MAPPQSLPKTATGIPGFEALSHGGLPRGRTTLLKGGPGSGKTVFPLQSLVNAVRRRREAGLFVAFEESTRQIVANAATFDWGLPALMKRRLFFLEAQLSPEVVHSGEFDLSGMLAMLKAKKDERGARWIVLDGIDVLLTLLHDPAAELREIYRLRDWLAANEMNAVITAKPGGGRWEVVNYVFMGFRVDCVVRCERRLEQGVSLHRLQIAKYRGSDFEPGEFPMSFGPSGMEVAPPEPAEIRHQASVERVSAGFERLDKMLGGGLFRGSSTLVTGLPGTSKTTLAGKFAEAACMRGERTLFVSFDEGAEPIQRNLASVGIRLRPHVKSRLLRMYSARTESTGAEDHLAKLKSLIRDYRPRCMVIDPLSAIAKAGARRREPAHLHGEGRRHHRFHHRHQRRRRPVDRGHRPAGLDHRRYLDSPVLHDPQRRAQPRADDHQIARHLALQPGARADPRRRRPGPGGRVYRRRRGADGHAALGERGRGARQDPPAARCVRLQAPRAAGQRNRYPRPHQGPAKRPGTAAHRARPVLHRQRSAHRLLERAREGAAPHPQRGPGEAQRQQEWRVAKN